MRNAFRILVGKFEEQKSLRRPAPGYFIHSIWLMKNL
jgi:hypothetical protein